MRNATLRSKTQCRSDAIQHQYQDIFGYFTFALGVWISRSKVNMHERLRTCPPFPLTIFNFQFSSFTIFAFILTHFSCSGTNLLQVASHEIGHSLGLAHSDVQQALMAPFYRGYMPYIDLHDDDIQAVQELYGELLCCWDWDIEMSDIIGVPQWFNTHNIS